jgi:NAD(P)-dependent dehydrogenase (short-subunit alcohol dehydrogenase family)
MASVPSSLFDVAGRSALVVGATGAFGQTASKALAGGGASLSITGGRADLLEHLGRTLRAGGTPVQEVTRRPESEEDAAAMVDAAVDAYGRLDLVVIASGMNRVAPIVEQPVADWDAVMKANVRGSWLVCRAAGRRLIGQGEGGKVVLVSSTRGRVGLPGYSAYSPSKGAIDLLTRTLACEWGKFGINVNAIAPTVFRSDLTAWMYDDRERGRDIREAILGRIPLGRLGEPEDFVGSLLFFLSRASDFCTGQILYVDGGYTVG